uniref:NADH-ubiquinone oxidoreductase chain 4 n=1 Tax=Arthroleptis poecilonotus TaxID=577105 RepID=S4UZU4_ARTPO|nr:NADH dehydrogenase subunit 4 [Arthroleptis poecilonotus]
MLMITMIWLSMLITTYLSPKNYIWILTSVQSFIIAMFSIRFIILNFNSSNLFFSIDSISGPLAILTCWLFPLTMIASQNKILKEPTARQRLYIINMVFLQMTTLLAFTASDIMMFFIFFEASLIPTMITITRWGAQEQRLEAGMYLAFYTMFGAVPFIVFILDFYSQFGTLSMTMIQSYMFILPKISHLLMFWMACNLTFLVKMPMYMLHLWLPKAHVEAPIAGSMILAGTLLKLGGYGILRCSNLLPNITYDYITLLVISLFGVIATAALCLRQTDLKSLIAMSSVSHMNMVIIAAIIQTPTSYSGAMFMMIAHGLTSSALFCLANTIYERTNSRTMILLRGTLIMLPLAGTLWLYTLLFNLAIPPSINFSAELMIFLSMFSWSNEMFLLSSPNLILTVAYTLFILWSIQRGPLPKHLKTIYPTPTREQILILLHIIPALLLILNPNLFF